MEKINVEKNISDERIEELGIRQWPIWEKEISEFPWSYEQQETCYIIEGKAEIVSREGSQLATFEKGDLVDFPRGLGCVWKIKEPIRKHYKFS